MNKTIPCSIIKDIIPLYIDNLTSEDSNKIIREHIQECVECKDYYNSLVQHMESESKEKETKAVQEINYMKKIYAYQKGTLLLGGILSFLLGFLLPLIQIAIPVVLEGGIPDYYLARLQIAWQIGLFKMLISGLIACGIYLIVVKLLQKIKYH
ncbi:MAG: zf-HC2 domain-containing protein [Clostridia bacterium]